VQGCLMTDQKAFNRKLIEDFRESRAKDDVVLNDRPLLLLSTIGAKSGERHTTPVMRIPDGDRFVVIASNGGSVEHPLWFRILAAPPDVVVEGGKETCDGVARTASGEERERLWDKAVQVGPFFADYKTKVTREIPVVILERKKL